MLIKLLKYSKGYLHVRLKGHSPERFLNLCSNHNILIWNLVNKDNNYEFYISIKGFWKLKPILKKTKTRLIILEKKGLPFFFHHYKKRKMFFIGILLCITLLFILSAFIWEIDFEGNTARTDDVLLDFLTTQDIYSGVNKSRIDCEELEKAIRNEFNDIIWTSVEISGTKLIVSVKENTDTTITGVEDELLGSIASNKEGIITEMITRSGTPLVKVGDTVSPGSILVDGKVAVYNDSKEITKYNYCTADADIYAEVIYGYEDSFPLEYEVKNFTGNERKYLYFNAFDKVLSLQFPSTSYENYDSEYNEKQLIIGNNLYLPFSVGIKYNKEYLIEKKTYTNDEAVELANKKLDIFCQNLNENGVQILEKNVNIDTSGEICNSSGSITVIEKIGIRQETEIINILKEEENMDE